MEENLGGDTSSESKNTPSSDYNEEDSDISSMSLVKPAPAKEEFKCKIEGCNKKYSKRFRLTRHIRSAHEKRNITYICPKCQIPLSSLDSLRKHVKRRHERALPTCEFCQATFRKHNQLKAHRYIHTQEKPFKCDATDCEQSFVSLKNLNRHKKIHDKYACKHEGCSEVLNSWTNLRKHVLLKHPPNLTCSNCKKTFFSKQRLRYHEMVHKEDRQIFECPYDQCPRFYYYMRNLTQHIQSSHLGKFFLCPKKDCFQQLSTKQRLQQHMRLHDPKKALTKKKRTKAQQKSRKPRKDKGIPKTPIVSVITGVVLDKDTNKSSLAGATLDAEIELMKIVNEDDIVLSENSCESSSEDLDPSVGHSIVQNPRSGARLSDEECNPAVSDNWDERESFENSKNVSFTQLVSEPSNCIESTSSSVPSNSKGERCVTKTGIFKQPGAENASRKSNSQLSPDGSEEPCSLPSTAPLQQVCRSRKRSSSVSRCLHPVQPSADAPTHKRRRSASVRCSEPQPSSSNNLINGDAAPSITSMKDSVKAPEHNMENIFLEAVASGYQSSSESEKDK